MSKSMCGGNQKQKKKWKTKKKRRRTKNKFARNNNTMRTRTANHCVNQAVVNISQMEQAKCMQEQTSNLK